MRGALILVAGVLASACAEPLTTDECNALLERYTDLLVRSERPDVNPEELLRLRREARARAAAGREFAKCSTKVSRRQWDCAMSANAVDDLERCLL